MSDIVERLLNKKPPAFDFGEDHWRLRIEAADEIESLRQRVAELENELSSTSAYGEPVAWAATSEEGKIEALGFNQSRRFDTPLYFFTSTITHKALTQNMTRPCCLLRWMTLEQPCSPQHLSRRNDDTTTET